MFVTKTRTNNTIATHREDGCPTLEYAQAHVGGYIESVYSIPSDQRPNHVINCYANDEGAIRDGFAVASHRMPRYVANTYRIYGDCVFIAVDLTTGEWVPMLDQEANQIDREVYSTPLN